MKEFLSQQMGILSQFRLPKEHDKRQEYLEKNSSALLKLFGEFTQFVNDAYLVILKNALQLSQGNEIKKLFEQYGKWPIFCIPKLAKIKPELIEDKNTSQFLHCCSDRELNKRYAQLITLHSKLLFYVKGPIRRVGENKTEKTYKIISPVQNPQSKLIPLLQYVGMCYQALSWADPKLDTGIFNPDIARLAMSYGNVASIQFFFKIYHKILDQFTEPFPGFYDFNTAVVLAGLHKTPGCLFAALFCFYSAGYHMEKYCKAFSIHGQEISSRDDQEQKMAHQYAALSLFYLNKALKELSDSATECWNIYGKKPDGLWEKFFYPPLLNTEVQEEKSTKKLILRLGENMLGFYQNNMQLVKEILIAETQKLSSP